MKTEPAYLAEFSRPDALVDAAQAMTARGYRGLDAFSPFPVPHLDEALALPASKLPWWALAGAVTGGGLGYFMMWYSSVIDYPFNVGGRPLHSWPSYIPITFELSVLGTAIAVVLGVLFSCRLTRLHQPVFSVSSFQLASPARFFLLVPLAGAATDVEGARADLEQLEPEAIHELAGD